MFDHTSATLGARSAESSLPAWARVLRQLRAEAVAWPDPAQRFHSEAELVQRFGVSRVTARRAFESLAAEGLVRRVKGLGTFVCALPLAEDFTPTMEVEKGWRALGHDPVARVLSCRTLRADAAAATALGVARGTRLLFIKRVRAVSGMPIAVDERLVPLAVAQRCGLDAGTAAGSIIARLWQAGPLDTGRWSIEARLPTPEESLLLGIGPEQPVLARHMRYANAEGRCVLVGHSVHRADKVRYTLSLPLDRQHDDEAPETVQAEITG